MAAEGDIQFLPVYERWRATSRGRIADQLEMELLKRNLGDVSGKQVLDVGCGDGELCLWLAEHGADVVGVDASKDMLNAAQSRFSNAGLAVSLHQAEALSLPFEDETFDLVVAVTILCFVKDARGEFAEINRVLKPGGKLIIGELGRWSLWAARCRVRGWFGSPIWRNARFRSARELRLSARETGLSVETVEGAIFYPPIGFMTVLCERLDRILTKTFTFGAAFLLLVAKKPSQ
jgi:ubiquinone/menaquinone biosynthesis C-methylase UbiE